MERGMVGRFIVETAGPGFGPAATATPPAKKAIDDDDEDDG
jgi:hypothetical protein